MRWTRLTVLALLIGSISVAATAEDQRDLASAKLPPDVVALIGRRSGCDYWFEKGDPDYGVLRALKCKTIADDENALREKYQGNPAVKAALDATWIRVIRRVPLSQLRTLPSDSEH